MKERPILFSAPMVRAILAGTKTQTRRVLGSELPSDAPAIFGVQQLDDGRWGFFDSEGDDHVCPYGGPGDRLWVRETWQPIWAEAGRVPPHGYDSREGWNIHYPATDELVEYVDDSRNGDTITTACKPSIHMPRAFSRITLEVTGVRVERLQDISEDDARAEGVTPDEHDAWFGGLKYVSAFGTLWDSINGKRAPWASNPWVWTVSFRRLYPV